MRFAGRQDTVGQEFLWWACRRQVMELALARIFTLYGDPLIHIIRHLFAENWKHFSHKYRELMP